MTMQIKYTTKNVYGNETNYPASEDARTIALLTGRKTLTARDIQILKERGHEVERVLS